MKQIGARIRVLREKQGLTQQELADRLQVTRQTVSNYEIGRSQPDLEMLEQLANVLNVDVDVALLLGNGQTSVRVPVRSRIAQLRSGEGIPWGAIIAFLLVMPFVCILWAAFVESMGLYTMARGMLLPFFWPALSLFTLIGVDFLLEKQGKAQRWRLRLGTVVLVLLFVFGMAVWQEGAAFTRAQCEEAYFECKQFQGIVVELTPKPEGPSPGYDPDAEYHLVIYEGYIHDNYFKPEHLTYFTYYWDDQYVLSMWWRNETEWEVGDRVDVTVLYHPSQDLGEDPIWPVYDVKNYGKPKELRPWFAEWLQEWTQK